MRDILKAQIEKFPRFSYPLDVGNKSRVMLKLSVSHCCRGVVA